MQPLPAGPGDVLAVWSGANPVDDMIRVDEALMGKPAVANHVVIITHRDIRGRWIGIQGQPGGVGMVDWPGHVVCSSLAAMLYGLPQVGWAHPDLGAERKCKPADWWDWADRQLWIASRW